jgi:ABC-type amino acid transport substrate-binding protein
VRVTSKLFAAAAIVAVSISLASAKDWTKVRIGVEGAYPPFSEITPDGKLIGFDIDIANALCAEIKRYATQDEAYLDANAGRLDVLLADSEALSGGFLKTDKGADWEFVGPDYTDPKYFGDGAGIAVRKEDTDLRDKLNAAIKAIRDNGTYKAIQDKYFDYNIYGS